MPLPGTGWPCLGNINQSGTITGYGCLMGSLPGRNTTVGAILLWLLGIPIPIIILLLLLWH
jgi:hypothetical protein